MLYTVIMRVLPFNEEVSFILFYRSYHVLKLGRRMSPLYSIAIRVSNHICSCYRTYILDAIVLQGLSVVIASVYHRMANFSQLTPLPLPSILYSPYMGYASIFRQNTKPYKSRHIRIGLFLINGTSGHNPSKQDAPSHRMPLDSPQ